jgi:hypothetical protein
MTIQATTSKITDMLIILGLLLQRVEMRPEPIEHDAQLPRGGWAEPQRDSLIDYGDDLVHLIVRQGLLVTRAWLRWRTVSASVSHFSTFPDTLQML